MRWQFWKKPAIAIEEAVDDDLPALADIHEAGFPQAWDAESLAGMKAQPGMRIWVARVAGGHRRPIGFALVRNAAGEGEVITIATDPTHRRRGIGQALMDHAIRELQRERAERLFLEVSERNVAAIGLYRRLGFHQVGRREGYYRSQADEDGAPGALVMELDLR
jgi:ribosomal-protein-alanine N-acetyltransferase